MDKSIFINYRNKLVKVIENLENKERLNAEDFSAVWVMASALNEILASRGYQAKVTVYPLLVYHEAEDRI